MLKIAICDDEHEFLRFISGRLQVFFNKNGCTANINCFDSAQKMLSGGSFDIYFLDLDMPEMTGFEAAEYIREHSLNAYIVFVTSREELMRDSFDYQPFHFICKESASELESGLEHVLERLMRHFRQSRIITVNDILSGEYSLCLSELIYIKSDDHYLSYHLRGETQTIKERAVLKTREKELSDYDFIRVHKQYLVNMRHIDKMDIYTNTVVVSDGSKLPMSKLLKSDAAQAYMMFKRK